ncbi:MAG: DUF262 domain-containing protein [Byssovorax sp.]
MARNRSEALPPPSKLGQRPEARAFQIDELLPRVNDGKIRIPPFQRKSAWEDSDRLNLFDSIYRGYPIGTLLFWQREAPAARVELGSLVIDAPKRDDALWVVDGQQRITTLAEALLGRPSKGAQAIHFDLDMEKFFYSKVALVDDKAPPHQLPISVVLDANRLLEWLFSHPELGAPLRGVALDVGKRIREYNIPTYIVTTQDDHVLRTIFQRTNRAGRSLKEEDVFHSLFGSLSDEQPSDLRALAAAVSSLGFGHLDESDVLRALLAVKGISLDQDFTEVLRREDIPKALASTASALQDAIVFLRRDAGIAHVDLLPYTLPLVVLSKLFHEFPTPSERSRLLLRRWLWRGALGAQLTGAVVGMRQHLACVKQGDEEGSVQRLLALAGTEPVEDMLRFDGFSFRTARSKLQCCALSSFAPLDLRTGERIDIPGLFPDDGDEKVTFLFRGKHNAGEGAQGLANRLLHPRLPTRELVDAIISTNDEAVLRSHAISPQAQDALRKGDRAGFLALRESTLARLVRDYFQRQAEWGADDSGSLEAMIVDED